MEHFINFLRRVRVFYMEPKWPPEYPGAYKFESLQYLSS
jgi:hypothetical protein